MLVLALLLLVTQIASASSNIAIVRVVNDVPITSWDLEKETIVSKLLAANGISPITFSFNDKIENINASLDRLADVALIGWLERKASLATNQTSSLEKSTKAAKAQLAQLKKHTSSLSNEEIEEVLRIKILASEILKIIVPKERPNESQAEDYMRALSKQDHEVEYAVFISKGSNGKQKLQNLRQSICSGKGVQASFEERSFAALEKEMAEVLYPLNQGECSRIWSVGDSYKMVYLKRKKFYDQGTLEQILLNVSSASTGLQICALLDKFRNKSYIK